MSSLKLFEYAVIQQPLKKDGKVIEEGKILVGVETVLAHDETQVQLIAARQVPEDAMGDLGRLEVVVRPFEREKVLGIAGPRGASGVKGAAGDWTAYAMTTPTASSYTSLSNVTTGSSSGGAVIKLNS